MLMTIKFVFLEQWTLLGFSQVAKRSLPGETKVRIGHAKRFHAQMCFPRDSVGLPSGALKWSQVHTMPQRGCAENIFCPHNLQIRRHKWVCRHQMALSQQIGDTSRCLVSSFDSDCFIFRQQFCLTPPTCPHLIPLGCLKAPRCAHCGKRNMLKRKSRSSTPYLSDPDGCKQKKHSAFS